MHLEAVVVRYQHLRLRAIGRQRGQQRVRVLYIHENTFLLSEAST